jgi:hypothetical protein
MVIQISLIIIIIILLGYIIFLHFQLSKKNIFIESTVRRLSGIEKSRSMEEMMAFLSEIQRSNLFTSYFTDKSLSDNIIEFIFDSGNDIKTYIHYTKEENDARNILETGFKFTESFYKTALPVLNDKLDLTIKHNTRKYFGDYLIVISISNDIANFYSMELVKADIRNYFFENILTEKLPSINENSDVVYQLSPRFIKGYVNYKTGEIFKNPVFDPWHDSPSFMKNIESLRNK